ncbi:MFS transporter [Lysinibacillus sp. G01H]|uniref:MFS transporter n=1 Tax=Lysinibacillus sp. G01H TaxID=3026425 RepID=UPI00237D86FF|nr:MFS transporter [Lysinibacillus sp. G01H]WDU78324.1 MFS transporter [Lysinibacillus sp. G01H]
MKNNREIRKSVFAGSIGNIVEWFDYSIYAYFATFIAANVFITDDSLSSLLQTFATFAVGFLMRPVGALVIGRYGDKVGRKKALSLTIFIMTFATFLMGVIPSHEVIGIWAPILLLFARLSQGFSAGGEYGAAASYIVESANKQSRGFWGSFQEVSVSIGSLSGVILFVILTTTMPAPMLEAWGWRIPFILSGVLGIAGLYIRRNASESTQFEQAKQNEVKSIENIFVLFRKYKKHMLTGIGFTIFWTVSYYGLLTFIPSYLTGVLGLPNNVSLIAKIIAPLIILFFVPIFGYISDRVGRKPLLLTSSISLGILIYPLFQMIASGNSVLIVIAMIIYALLIAIYSGPGVATVVEIFPVKVRHSTLSFSYNVAVACFGGTAPFISTYLIQKTNMSIAPSFYIIFSAIITTIVLYNMKIDHSSKED